MSTRWIVVSILAISSMVSGCSTTSPPRDTETSLVTSTDVEALERANPPAPLPELPLGIEGDLTALPDPPTRETVRLGRWLFYDPRLSVDDSVSCATCPRPENGFSEPTSVSTGVGHNVFFEKACATSVTWASTSPRPSSTTSVSGGTTHDGSIATLR